MAARRARSGTSDPPRSRAAASSGTREAVPSRPGVPPTIPGTSGTVRSKGKASPGIPRAARDPRPRTARRPGPGPPQERRASARRDAPRLRRRPCGSAAGDGRRRRPRRPGATAARPSCRPPRRPAPPSGAARAALCPGTTKQGKSSVTTSAARVREPAEQAACGLLLRLHEGPVAEPEGGGGRGVVPHAFEHEAVEPPRGPGVVEAQPLVDHQRLFAARPRSAARSRGRGCGRDADRPASSRGRRPPGRSSWPRSAAGAGPGCSSLRQASPVPGY